MGTSHLEEDPTRGSRNSNQGLTQSEQRLAPQPAPRTSLLQSQSSQTGSVGCLASSPREAWTSPKSFRSFLEQREAALARRSRGPSLGSINESLWVGTQNCHNRLNNQDANDRRSERDSKYRILEQKVTELQDQVEEMQLSRWSYEDSTARLAGFLSGFASQLSLAGEHEDDGWSREGEKEVAEEKVGGWSYSALPRQVLSQIKRRHMYHSNLHSKRI